MEDGFYKVKFPSGEKGPGYMKKNTGERVSIKEDDLKNLREKAGKLRKTEESLLLLNQELSEMKDRFVRLAAEFENFKKRTEKEKQDIYRYGLENFIIRLIPFDDIFESVIRQMEKKPSPEIIHQGLRMLKSEFAKILEGAGVKRINSKDGIFDANLHEASELVETEELDEGRIIEEDRSGFSLNDKIIRPSLVKVARKKSKETGRDESENTGSSKS